ncbi:hypothetical protein C1I98_37475 [Spongiactinospora gelatinilytica]|uniref:Histidine kinase/HSP90-like ATPase domain-containing protein n=1 Tax=Spongiactinospora gelatinilytica TaxID=2666298 RepID=A0A2W2EWA8_9ACTN|nr:ATP-binding protein [Spongiactinospora gelatinilytica]PZG20565.1 hypothetical protein C1I98_37475 [Spongiactinospora gelatinilytica]
MSQYLHVTPLPSTGAAVGRARAVLREVLRDATPDDLYDAELALAEIAGNAVRHSCPPYVLRMVMVGEHPVWCEVVDGHQGGLAAVLDGLSPAGAPGCDEVLADCGRGLMLVRVLSDGCCAAYPLRSGRAKAVGFALPVAIGAREPVRLPRGRFEWLAHFAVTL